MSRTYRCRHMPVYSGGRSRWRESHARKIVDGNGGLNWKRRQRIIDAETERLFGPKPPPPHLRWIRSKGLTHTAYTPGRYETVHGVNPWSGKVGDWIKWYEYPKKIVRPGRWMKKWEMYEWERLRDLVESEYVWPTASWHPWMRRPFVGNGLKRWYRTAANRRTRRHDRQILHSQIIDEDWDGHFMHRREGFDWWDLY